MRILLRFVFVRESCNDSMIFWKKDSVRVRVWKRTVQVLYGFTLILFQRGEMRFQCYLRFGLEIEPFLWILGCVFPLVSRFSLLSSFFWIRILWDFFPSSSQPSCFCDRAEFVTNGDELGARIAEEAIRWWRFSDESLRIATIFAEFGLDSDSGNLGFMHLFLSFLWTWWFWSVTAKRENVKFVCWSGAWMCKFWHLEPYIGWHVDCGPTGMRHVDLELLAWPWTESEKKRTNMQICKIWDCFAIF